MRPRLIGKLPLWWKPGKDTRRSVRVTRPPATGKTSIPVGAQTSPPQVVEKKSFDIAPAILVKPGYGGIHSIMSKRKVTLTGFMLLLVLLIVSTYAEARNPGTKNNSKQSGTLQKMIVENASVTMQVDLNGLNGSSSLV